MSYKYHVRVEKEPSEKAKNKCPEHLELDRVYIKLTDFTLSSDLSRFEKHQVRNLINKRLETVRMVDVNSDYSLDNEEKVFLVQDYDSENPIFSDEMDMPDHLVQKEEGRKVEEVKEW